MGNVIHLDATQVHSIKKGKTVHSRFIVKEDNSKRRENVIKHIKVNQMLNNLSDILSGKDNIKSVRKTTVTNGDGFYDD